MTSPNLGHIGWFDLTVPDATPLKDFYADVFGWQAETHDMGSYDDFSMLTSEGTRVAGICHAKGDNTTLPPVWLPYICVASLDDALKMARQRGGTVLQRRGVAGEPGIAFLRDPAGAYFALWQQKAHPISEDQPETSAVG